jgi:hypothetical protein
VDGTEANSQSGGKTEYRVKSRRKILKKWQKKLKVDSLKVNKVSSEDSMFRDTFNTQLLDRQTLSHDSIEDIALARNAYEEWENRVEKAYNEDDILSIHGIISYLQNQHNGYGKSNDEDLYAEEVKGLHGQLLLEEARQGWALLLASKKLRKEYQDERQLESDKKATWRFAGLLELVYSKTSQSKY